MIMRRMLLSSAILLLVLAAPAAAQETEEAAVREVIQRLFDGMRSRDTAMIRSTFADQAQFYGLDREGAVRVDTPSAFITSIASAPEGMVLDEVLHDTEVRIDGPLAVVWTYYDFFAGENFSHCGYDAFQLLKVQGEWKIVALADTRRREGCRQQRS